MPVPSSLYDPFDGGWRVRTEDARVKCTLACTCGAPAQGADPGEVDGGNNAGHRLSLRGEMAIERVVLTLLVLFVLLTQLLDLLTALHMVLSYGVDAELNPLLRTALIQSGLAGATAFKLGGATVAVVMWLALARAGRGRLARNCLLLAVAIGLVGVLSNGSLRSLTPL